MMATLIFEISWDASIPAKLMHVRDNALDKLSEPVESPDGRITLTWEADEELDHTIDWDLFAVGNTLTELTAVAAWKESEPTTLGEAKEAKNRWPGNGVLRHRGAMS
jgi:hypothetical protein